MSAAFDSVSQFERAMANFAGSRYAVAVESCTAALFLCLKYVKAHHVMFPARTYISAVNSAIHAGATIEFKDYQWEGTYCLEPYDIWDSALRLRKGMYQGGFHCLSFHA